MTQRDPALGQLQHDIASGFDAVLSGLDEPASGEPGLSHSLSLSWPDKRLNESLVPLVRGDLYPDLVKIGKRSSLIGAIAVAINSVRHGSGAQELFQVLSNVDREQTTMADSTRHVEARLQAIRNFKLPVLRGVTFSPLVDSHNANPVQSMPFPRAFEAINQGSAVIVPLPSGIIHERPKGRQLWSTITGYRERVVLSGGGDSDSADKPSAAVKQLRTEFAVVTAVRDIGLLATVGAEPLDELSEDKSSPMDALLGDARFAYVISPVAAKTS